MPPRRSSRAPSAAPEPAETLPAKRKRGQSTQPEEATTAKPPSRARSSRASATKTRASGPSRTSLPDVAESADEEEEEAAPAKKKSRPSVESTVKAEEEDEEEEEPERPAKGARRAAPGSRTRRTSSMTVDEPAELPKRRTSRQPSTSNRAGRNGRVASVEEPEDEEEDLQPKRSRRVVKEEPVSEAEASEEEQESDEPSAPKARKGKGKAPTRQPKAAGKKVPKKVVVVQSDDEEDDDDSPPPPAYVSPSKAASKPQVVEPEQEEEEEEEKSLFDPVPMPDPESLPRAVSEEPQGPKPRLVISKMALVNFKSYAGRQEIGPFHKSFSAIVGPNGSGKSNTIDALLFVFGYRASKMRQGKVSELIHNSARYPDLEECSVEVHFRDIIDLPGPDAYEVVPGSKLVVARTAYKNNNSKYTINGKTATYKEVQALLKGRGIDLDHNRFLILQGEVESIAQMKPKAQNEHEDGLLEYLEDIIGTSQLKGPIEEAMVEVEKLQEERQTKMHRLRIVEKEKMALEEKRREAINFYKLKNDHTRAQSRYLQWYIWQFQESQAKKEAEHKDLQGKLDKEAEKNKENIQFAKEMKDHIATQEEIFKQIQKGSAEAVSDLKEKEKIALAVKERQKHAKTRKKKLEKSVQDDTVALRAAKHMITDSGERLDKATTSLEKYRDELVDEEEELEKIQDSLRGKTETFHKKIQEKQKELQPWTTKIDAKTTELDVAKNERETLVQRSEALQKSVDDAVDALSALQADQQEKLRDQEGLKKRKEQLKKDMTRATERQQNARAAAQKWRGDASSFRGRLDEARANQSQNRSRGALLDALTRLGQQGRIRGFHGRLGDLGTIPDKYDVAISTAAGGQLSNMIVEQVDQGKACIDYLRSNSLGRASFMVLEKLQNNPRMNPIETPEGVPRLFDLIKPKDEMYRKAFYKALGDTLVAENTDQANRLAFGKGKRWRVVTLQGNLIEMSGAMSGGGGQPQRGAMNSKLAKDISPETVRQYERDAETAEEELQKAVKELQEADAELEKLQRAGPEIDMAYQKLTMEIETRKTRIAESTRRMEELKAQNKPSAGDAARIKELDRQIASHTAALEKLQDGAAKITEAITELEQQILKIGGAKLMTQKSKVEGIRNYINLTNDTIDKAEAEKNKAESDVKRLSAALETNQEQLTEVSEELRKLDKEVKEVEEYLDALRAKVDEAQQEVESKREELDGYKAELNKAEESLSEYNQKELKYKQKMSDIQGEIDGYANAILEKADIHDRLELINVEEEEDDSDDEEEEEHAEGGDGEGDGGKAIKPDPDQPERRAKKTEELKTYRKEELAQFKHNELVADTELLDEKIKNSKVDLTVLKEYKKQQALFDNRAKELDDVTKERDAKKKHYDDLRKQRLEEFMSGFNSISVKLKEMYQMITLGGNAELELVDSMDPFSEGIIFSVMPPKKSWKNISNLSGGEKTLSSLALVFALHVFKPTPLYFMDEIDAALDFRNVSIVANYIKDRTKNAQFIIISLRNDMFELSHRLIGIYKTANATRSISIDNHKLLTTIPPPTNATS